MKDCKEKLGGALILYKNKDCCEVLSAHTTKSMCIAYATNYEKKVGYNFKIVKYLKYIGHKLIVKNNVLKFFFNI